MDAQLSLNAGLEWDRCISSSSATGSSRLASAFSISMTWGPTIWGRVARTSIALDLMAKFTVLRRWNCRFSKILVNKGNLINTGNHIVSIFDCGHKLPKSSRDYFLRQITLFTNLNQNLVFFSVIGTWISNDTPRCTGLISIILSFRTRILGVRSSSLPSCDNILGAWR